MKKTEQRRCSSKCSRAEVEQISDKPVGRWALFVVLRKKSKLTMPLMPPHRGTGGDASTTPRSSARHTLSVSRGSTEATSKTKRAGPSSRGAMRVTMHNKNGSMDRPEHPLSSLSRAAAEEGAAAGGDSPFASRGAGGVGITAGGHRRVLSDMSLPHR